MRHLLIFLTLTFSGFAFAGTDYCYLGTATVSSIDSSRKEGLVVLDIKSINYPDPETVEMRSKYHGISLNQKIEATFPKKLQEGKETYFMVRYICGKDGCSTKKWQAINKAESHDWKKYCLRR